MATDWTREELSAAVHAYVEMLELERCGESFTKKKYYDALSRRFDRSSKAFEYRMQNISHVYAVLGRQWLAGLKPAKNVGAKVLPIIEELISEHENTSSSPEIAFHASVDALRKTPNLKTPVGVKKPEKRHSQSTVYSRDPAVVAWVLRNSGGKCEVCSKTAPFLKYGGDFYLEVHHLRRLADGGPDTICNAVAACPNCHRELHFGELRRELMDTLYEANERLHRY